MLQTTTPITTRHQHHNNNRTIKSPSPTCSSPSSSITSTSPIHQYNSYTTTTITNVPSSSRERKAARRKEKSRVAAQIRRNKESQTLILLQNSLPIALPSPSIMLEKSIVIRISGQTLFLLNNLDQVLGTKCLVTTLLESPTFLGIFTNSLGQIVYVSPSIQNRLDQYHWSNLIGLPLQEVLEYSTPSPIPKSVYSKTYPYSSSSNNPITYWPQTGDIVKLRLTTSATPSNLQSPLPSPSSNDTPSRSSSVRMQRSQSFASSLSNLSLSSPSSNNNHNQNAFFSYNKNNNKFGTKSTLNSSIFNNKIPATSSGFFKTPVSSSSSSNLTSLSVSTNNRSLLALKIGSSPLFRFAYSNCSLFSVWCSCNVTHTNSNLRLLLLQPMSTPTTPTTPTSNTTTPTTIESYPTKNISTTQSTYFSSKTSNSTIVHSQQSTTPFITSVIDKYYDFELVSSEFSQLLGMDEKSLKSLNFLDIIHINDIIQVKTQLDKINTQKLQSQIWTPIYRVKTSKGIICYLKTLIKPIKSNPTNQTTSSTSSPPSSSTLSTNSNSNPSLISSQNNQDLIFLSHTIIKYVSKNNISPNSHQILQNENNQFFPTKTETTSISTISKQASPPIINCNSTKINNCSGDFILTNNNVGCYRNGSLNRNYSNQQTNSYNRKRRRLYFKPPSPQSTTTTTITKTKTNAHDNDNDDNKYSISMSSSSSLSNSYSTYHKLADNFNNSMMIKRENLCPSLKRKSFSSICTNKLKEQMNRKHKILESNKTSSIEQSDPLLATMYSLDDSNRFINNQDDDSIFFSSFDNQTNASSSYCNQSSESNSSDDLNIQFDDVIHHNQVPASPLSFYWDCDNNDTNINQTYFDSVLI